MSAAEILSEMVQILIHLIQSLSCLSVRGKNTSLQHCVILIIIRSCGPHPLSKKLRVCDEVNGQNYVNHISVHLGVSVIVS